MASQAAMRTAKRRQRARALRAEGLSVRQIAAKMAVNRGTISRDLRRPVADDERGAPEGNENRLVHGTRSEKVLAPLRQRFATVVRELYPTLDEVRTATLADRLARLEAARAWLDEQRSIVRDDLSGDPWPLLDRVEAWANSVDRQIGALEQEREGKGVHPLTQYLERRALEDGSGVDGGA